MSCTADAVCILPYTFLYMYVLYNPHKCFYHVHNNIWSFHSLLSLVVTSCSFGLIFWLCSCMTWIKGVIFICILHTSKELKVDKWMVTWIIHAFSFSLCFTATLISCVGSPLCGSLLSLILFIVVPCDESLCISTIWRELRTFQDTELSCSIIQSELFYLGACSKA